MRTPVGHSKYPGRVKLQTETLVLEQVPKDGGTTITFAGNNVPTLYPSPRDNSMYQRIPILYLANPSTQTCKVLAGSWTHILKEFKVHPLGTFFANFKIHITINIASGSQNIQKFDFSQLFKINIVTVRKLHARPGFLYKTNKIFQASEVFSIHCDQWGRRVRKGCTTEIMASSSNKLFELRFEHTRTAETVLFDVSKSLSRF
mmetsp:Transcript_22757/g.29705  ORF Transcript_22757/g.29705 Transcript_22757/m.29705 type:complete len:203 (+) Transcript_22757:329-937(+)